jgi:hypothetical protein
MFTLLNLNCFLAVPNPVILSAMLKRQAELYNSKLVERAHSLLHTNPRAISHHIQLRVVREYGLPDSIIQVLQSHKTPSEEDLLCEARYHTPRRERHKTPIHHHHTLPCHHHHHHHVRQQSPCLRHHTSHHHITVLHDEQRCPSSPVSPIRSYTPHEVSALSVHVNLYIQHQYKHTYTPHHHHITNTYHPAEQKKKTARILTKLLSNLVYPKKYLFCQFGSWNSCVRPQLHL